MKKLFKIIPLYSIIPLVAMFSVHMLVYYGSKLINSNFEMYDLTTAFDKKVPVIAPFIVIYILCFVYWLVAFFYTAYTEKEQFYTFITSSIICYLICLIFYFALPTTIGRPEIENTNIFNWMILFIYDVDTPTNLLPSIHCLVTWQIYKCLWKQKSIPKACQIGSLIFAILVCISTQVVKQHYIVDMIAAITISEVVFRLTKRFKIYKYPQIFFEGINTKLKLI